MPNMSLKKVEMPVQDPMVRRANFEEVALGYTAETVPALPPYLHLLGARREALPLLKHASLPLSHSLAKLEKENDACARMAAAQAGASDFGALCRREPGPMGGVYRQKIIFLTN